MFKMSVWRSAAVQWVAEAFEDTGMSYTHRVGEQVSTECLSPNFGSILNELMQVFHPLLMALLLPPCSVRQFGGLGPFGHHNGTLVEGVGV